MPPGARSTTRARSGNSGSHTRLYPPRRAGAPPGTCSSPSTLPWPRRSRWPSTRSPTARTAGEAPLSNGVVRCRGSTLGACTGSALETASREEHACGSGRTRRAQMNPPQPPHTVAGVPRLTPGLNRSFLSGMGYLICWQRLWSSRKTASQRCPICLIVSPRAGLRPVPEGGPCPREPSPWLAGTSTPTGRAGTG